MGLLEATAGGMVVYPTFSRRTSCEDGSPKDAISQQPDPRQLFFERAGQQTVQDEGARLTGSYPASPLSPWHPS